MDVALLAVALLLTSFHFGTTAAAAAAATTTVCKGEPADIIFAMDESSSIWPPHFRKQREFLANLIDGFDIGPDRTRVAVVTFADDYTSRFHLDAFQSKEEVKAAVRRIDQKTGGTRTDLALQHIREKMLERSRDEVPKIVILVTDGVSSQRDQTTEQSMLLKSENVTVLVVAISSQINWDEINSIASEPLAKHVFGIRSFDDLSHQLVGQLLRTACDVTENPAAAPRVTRRPTTTARTTTAASTAAPTSRRPRTTLPRTTTPKVTHVTSPRKTAPTTTPRTTTPRTTTPRTTTPRTTTTTLPPMVPLPLVPSIHVYSERETRFDLDRSRQDGAIGISVGGAGGENDGDGVSLVVSGGDGVWHRQQQPPPRGEVNVMLPPLRHDYQGLVARPEGVFRIDTAVDVSNGGGGGGSSSGRGGSLGGHGGGSVSTFGVGGHASIQLIADRQAAKLRPHGDDREAIVADVSVVDDPISSGVVIRVLPQNGGGGGDRAGADWCDLRGKKADLALVFGGRRRESASATLEALQNLARDATVPIGSDGVRLAMLPALPRGDVLCSCWNGDAYAPCSDNDVDYAAAGGDSSSGGGGGSGGLATEFGFADYGADRFAVIDHLSGRTRRREARPGLAHHIEQLRTRVFKPRRGAAAVTTRKEADKIAVIVVDTLPADLAPVIEAATLAKNAGIRLVLVSVGGSALRDDLVTLASDPPSQNVFVARGHSRPEDIAKYLRRALC